jgi:xanthine dehydrogenase accessory factor
MGNEGENTSQGGNPVLADHIETAACAVAHGRAPAPAADRTLVAAFASPVASYLLHFASDTGFRAVLVEPDMARAGAEWARPYLVTGEFGDFLDDSTDVVVTDHHRSELGVVLRDALASKARWVGILGNPRHQGPHIEALADLGVPDEEIGRVHRPVGLNIGSRTPPEIAIATLAGLIADRNGRPGGFEF